MPQARKPVPTFAGHVPVVSAAVSDGTRRTYGSYWNRIIEHWGGRRLDEPTPSQIRQLMTFVKTHVVERRNAPGRAQRGGAPCRGAALQTSSRAPPGRWLVCLHSHRANPPREPSHRTDT
jgi:hypothetical protein